MNYFKKIIVIVFLIFLYHKNIHAQSLPTYDPIYLLMQELQDRGYACDLSQLNTPYTLADVWYSIHQIESCPLSGQGVFIVDQLQEQLFRYLPSYPSDDTTYLISHLNLRTDGLLESGDVLWRNVLRGGAGAAINDHIYAHVGIVLNQYDYNNADYRGYKWRGFAGYTEQAYIAGQWQRLQVKLGRDFLRWGAGRSGTLVFSDVARPLDMLQARVHFGPFRFMSVAAELDEHTPLMVNNERIPVRRFLAGHRLDVHLWNGRLQAGVAEVLVYGGAGESFRLAYLNPVMIYKGAHKNGASYYGNILPTLDLLVYPLRTWQVYGSLLIDDIQVEKTGPGDLEPNELGWIAGTRYADPAGISGLTMGGEYVRVTNRTYKSPFPLETFAHRGKPLGYPSGNDFDLIELSMSYWTLPCLWLRMAYSHIRQGEGSIFTPWDAPWLTRSVAEGYSEPFPTGVVETQQKVRLSMRWFVHPALLLWADASMTSVTNDGHQPDEKRMFWQARLRVELNLHYQLRIEN